MKIWYDDISAYLAIIVASLTGIILLLHSLQALPYATIQAVWDPVRKIFGYAAFIFGTLYVSLLAIAIAAPVGVFTSVYIVRYAPENLRRYYSMIVEALAGIPSVVYGLWGLMVLGGIFGTFRANKLVAALTLSIMLLPTTISLTRTALESVPREIIEASFALGAMEHEAIMVSLGFSKPQIFGAILIALMRAIGETMAVTMTIGNVVDVSLNPLDPGSTLTSLIATEFSGAIDPIHRSAIMLAALILFGISVAIYSLSRRVMGREKRI